MSIRNIKARQILDARGEPTVEVDLITDIGLLRSSCPGVSYPAENGAKEIRDGDAAEYNGRSVHRVVDTINNVIAPKILKSKLNVNQQREIDLLMCTLDGTPDKSKLGANAMLAVSVACCKAAAAKRGLPLYRYIASLCETNGDASVRLPVPVISVASGGRAAGNGLVYQEFLVMPTGATSFAEAMRMGCEIYRKLEEQIGEEQELQLPLGVLDDGSFGPEAEDDKAALAMIDEAIKSAGYTEGSVKIAVNVAASAFCKDGKYDLEFKTEDSDPENHLEPEALLEQYTELRGELPIVATLIDPFDHEDWDGWSALIKAQPELQVVADQLTAMNKERIEEAVEKQAANCMMVRLSIAGTITDAIECVKMAKEAGWDCLVSAGDGETEDTFIADFAVGIGASQFKAGAPCRGERVAKYNQIMRIEGELSPTEAKYAGGKFQA